MRWNPDTPLSDLFENFFRSHSNERMERKHYDCSPSTNILEKDDSFELHMAVPGVKKEDVKIDLEKNVLSISSEKKAEKTEEVEGKYSSCLLYTSDAADDLLCVDLGGRRIIKKKTKKQKTKN